MISKYYKEPVLMSIEFLRKEYNRPIRTKEIKEYTKKNYPFISSNSLSLSLKELISEKEIVRIKSGLYDVCS